MTDDKKQTLKAIFYFDREGKTGKMMGFAELTEAKHPAFGSIWIRKSALKGQPVSINLTAEIQYE